jgi:CheY-like chemotaxis protein
MNTAPNASKGTVLLVDDDKFLLEMYSMKFTQQGYTVESFLSANDALKTLRGGFVPDVVLFDIMMPELDGFAFLQALTTEKLAPRALRIALTNQSDDAEKARAETFGTVRYLVKASTIPSEVVNIVAEELAKNRSKS